MAIYTYDENPDVRRRFEPGIAMARTGDLGRLANRGIRDRRTRGDEQPQLVARRRAVLAAGRETTRERGHRRLEQLVASTDAADLEDLLRREYEDGASLDSLQRLTGLGRARFRAALSAADVALSRAGVNTGAAKRRRADVNDAQVALSLGVADVPAWLREQREAGRTVRELASRIGRSEAWVRSRLNGRTTTARAATTTDRATKGQR